MQTSTTTTLFFINWILKFQQGMILLLQCQQSILLKPALAGRDIQQKAPTFLLPAGPGQGGQQVSTAGQPVQPPPTAGHGSCYCWRGNTPHSKRSKKPHSSGLSFSPAFLCLSFPLPGSDSFPVSQRSREKSQGWLKGDRGRAGSRVRTGQH